MYIFSYPSVLTYVLGAQKNRLIETVLLSTHNICFGREIRKLNFRLALLTKVLPPHLMGESIRINSPDTLAQSVMSLIADPGVEFDPSLAIYF